MDSISIRVPVTVKAKLTEKLKARILNELAEGIKRAELELQQIDVEEARVMREEHPDENTADGVAQIRAIRAHFGQERQKRLEYREQALAKQEETQKLALGAEIIQGTLDRQTELKIGDDMRDIMNVEILVEDDKIVAIRS